MYSIQSIRFSKSKYTLKEAKAKAIESNFKVNVKPNPQYKNYHSFRQRQPSAYDPSTFRIVKPSPDIIIVIGKEVE